MITCKLEDGKYVAKYVSPLFKLGPKIQGVVKLVENFCEAVDDSMYISDERKRFLKDRYLYWKNLDDIHFFNTCDEE